MKIMKNTLLLTPILVVLFGACNRDERVGPTDPLYRTWQLTQFVYNDGRTVTPSNPSSYNIVRFRPNGTILYGVDGRYVACCSPHRFRREGNTLDFTKVSSIPLPEVDNAEQCNLVDCGSPGNAWQILNLTDKQLILKTYFGTATYQPYP